MEIVEEVYQLSRQLPKGERFGLSSQMTRAAVSVPSNIAEGSSRRSRADFKRFLEIALGSAFELETQLLIIQRVQLLKSQAMGRTLNLLNEEQKMISAYITAIRSENKPKLKSKT